MSYPIFHPKIRIVMALAITIFVSFRSLAQKKETVWSLAEKPLADLIRGLRALPDDVRARTTKDLALKIRQLPVTPPAL